MKRYRPLVSLVPRCGVDQVDDAADDPFSAFLLSTRRLLSADPGPERAIEMWFFRIAVRCDAPSREAREGERGKTVVLMDVRNPSKKLPPSTPHRHWVAPRRSRTLEMCSFLIGFYQNQNKAGRI